MNQNFLDRQIGLQQLKQHKMSVIQKQIIESQDKKIQEFDADRMHNQKTIAKVAYMSNTPYAIRPEREHYKLDDKIADYQTCQKSVPTINHTPSIIELANYISPKG